jgi:branched-chain amino acid transport system permease protein
VSVSRLAAALAVALLAVLPFGASEYALHIAIQILIWGFIYTAWSIMGRFGLTSFGHGAFLGVGAYVPALLWNFAGVAPWLGIPASMALAVLLAVVIGYPCFRLRVVCHYFALVPLAPSQVVLLTLIAARDVTGGSLGMTLNTVGHSWAALQFPEKSYFYFFALAVWLGGLAVWRWIDAGLNRVALEAISEDEIAAASVGIDVMREKLRVTVVSAALTALGGSLFSPAPSGVATGRSARRRLTPERELRRRLAAGMGPFGARGGSSSVSPSWRSGWPRSMSERTLDSR